jgi:hypothetical protein
MTRDDIIRMAREAGLYVGTNLSGVQLVGAQEDSGLLIHMNVDELERFAALVAAAEREACAKIADEVGDDDEDCHAWAAADAIRARGAE